MKKIIALWVSVSIIGLSSAPVTAQQAPRHIVRGVKALTSRGTQKAFTPRLGTSASVPAAAAGNIAAAKALSETAAIQGTVARTPVLSGAANPALNDETAQTMHRKVERTVVQATLGENLTYAQIRERVANGHTARVAERILTYPNANVRVGMLRNEFVQVALAGNATEGQLARAAQFWRTDLQASLGSFSSLPDAPLTAWVGEFRNKNASVRALNQALADVAALGVYGTEKDGALILDFYRKAAHTPAEPLAEAAAARALLRLGAKEELAALSAAAGSQGPLWNSVARYAQQQGVSLSLSAAPETAAQTDAFVPVLKTLGKVNTMAADPSAEATTLYMNLGRQAPAFAGAPAMAAAPVLPAVELPKLTLPANETLRADALSVPAGGSAAQTAEQTTGQTAKAFSFLGRTQKDPAGNSGVLYGGIPVPALWNGAKKVFSSVKKFLSPKKVQPAAAFQPQQATGLKGALQRASLYAASYIIGLEVATPVIANIGSSFNLSLSDNILVAVATYLPYSVGAFLSNWIKEKFGRKAAMNLGLGLMATGFTAGVTLFGLNGAFVPQADMWAHFYSILGCIMLASTGGVFVHNAVGPMMTDLSKGASDLVLQKRTANTELSRALGMMSSFAFPFISTNVLGMDWSFTFALPIPLVAAAALGVNLSKIPNTKPALEAKPAQPTAEDGKRGRRAYTLTSSLLNNSYVRLFKEEKGVAGLLLGLMLMNAVEMSYNNGFLFLLPELTGGSSSQYIFGLLQFAVPFLIGRNLAKGFLKWFPKNNMSIATLLAGAGGLAALPFSGNVYALTAALFAAEVGISTAFTLAFARTAKNAKTQDRIVALIVASAISCAFGPMLLTNLAENLMAAGVFSSADATTAAMIGIPSALAVLSALIFKRIEGRQAPKSAQGPAKPNWFKRIINRLLGRSDNPPVGNN